MDASELTARLRKLDIRQEGDPVLRQECAPFDLPAERAEAFALWERLRGYVGRLQEIDHLRGTLTRDLVRPDARLVPLAEYRGASQEWRY